MVAASWSLLLLAHTHDLSEKHPRKTEPMRSPACSRLDTPRPTGVPRACCCTTNASRKGDCGSLSSRRGPFCSWGAPLDDTQFLLLGSRQTCRAPPPLPWAWGSSGSGTSLSTDKQTWSLGGSMWRPPQSNRGLRTRMSPQETWLCCLPADGGGTRRR